MYKLLSVLAIVAVAFLFFESGYARKCYVCNSYFQQDCVDYFNNHTHNLVDCGDNVTMCRKIVQEVYYNDEWNLRYIRQCAPSGEVGGDEGRECTDRTGTYRVKMRYCQCGNQDGCNGASSLNFPIVMIIVPVLASLKYFLSNSL